MFIFILLLSIRFTVSLNLLNQVNIPHISFSYNNHSMESNIQYHIIFTLSACYIYQLDNQSLQIIQLFFHVKMISNEYLRKDCDTFLTSQQQREIMTELHVRLCLVKKHLYWRITFFPLICVAFFTCQTPNILNHF